MFQSREWWQYIFPPGGEEVYSYTKRESTSSVPLCTPLIFRWVLADEFGELWHYLGAHDLQPWIFEGCLEDGGPAGLLMARIEYIRLMSTRDILRDLLRVYRSEQREYMFRIAHAAFAVAPEALPLTADYAPSPFEAEVTNGIVRRAAQQPVRRLRFER